MFGLSRKPREIRTSSPNRSVRAKYDAAQTTHENRRHWANADQLSASAAMSREVRCILISRAQYEYENNSYCRGIVNTLANYTIGTGPRLQMLAHGDSKANSVIEERFGEWMLAAHLTEKLHTLRISETVRGEAIALLTDNDRIDHPVKLDVAPIEAERLQTPWPKIAGPNQVIDGIEFDEAQNPLRYHVMRYHPGDRFYRPNRNQFLAPIPAEAIIHHFKHERAGQIRGVSAIAPALPLFAMLRRYTLAVLTAAENAALPGGVIHSEAAPDTGEIVKPELWDEIELERGMWMTLPDGWNITQIKAEQPTTMYPDFKREVLNEIARCLDMPYNVAAGNSSGYNYASGRLDHQAFFRSLRVQQRMIEINILDRIFAAWIDEASLIEDYLPRSAREISADLKHEWFWDGHEHVDPAKEAAAQNVRLRNFTTTYAAEYGRQGRDWESAFEQIKRERDLLHDLKLTPEAVSMPGRPVGAPVDEADENEDKGS